MYSNSRPNSYETVVDFIPALRAFARVFYRNEVDADDLVQETLIKAIEHIDQFQPGTKMKSWLFTIMRNAFYTQAKKSRRESPGVNDCASCKRSVEAGQEWAARSNEIQNAMASLQEAQRQVLVLVAMLGTSYDDAAKICECNVGTIKSRLNRARHALLEAMGESSIGDAVRRLPQISRHRLDQHPAFLH